MMAMTLARMGRSMKNLDTLVFFLSAARNEIVLRAASARTDSYEAFESLRALSSYLAASQGLIRSPSFPHALSGNPDEFGTGPPIRTFGGDAPKNVLSRSDCLQRSYSFRFVLNFLEPCIRFFKLLGFWLRRRAARGLLGVNRAPWNCLKAAFNNHQVVGFKTFVDNQQFTHLRPGLDAAPLNYVLIVHD